MSVYAGRALLLPVSAPFHCRLMKPAQDIVQKEIHPLTFIHPTIDIISNATGRPMNHLQLKPLIVSQITSTVQWHASINYLVGQEGVHDFIAVGPHRVVSNLLKKEYPDGACHVVSVSTLEDLKKLKGMFK